MIAALFIDATGTYSKIDDIELWAAGRDARLYNGPYSVVAHPPCQRWGRYAKGGPSAKPGKFILGDDNGCFESALKSVRQFGGVLEHPEASHAFAWYGIKPKPPRFGGWIKTECDAYVCCVEQGHYGHRARKATWLYLYGYPGRPPELKWGPSQATAKLDAGMNREERRSPSRKWYDFDYLTSREKSATPDAFRDLLISLAEKCTGKV